MLGRYLYEAQERTQMDAGIRKRLEPDGSITYHRLPWCLCGPDHQGPRFGVCGACGNAINDAEPGYAPFRSTTSTIHECPPVGSGITPCCGKTPFELPQQDRLTENREIVTCKRILDSRNESK